MTSKLQLFYKEITKRLEKIEYNKLWPNFRRFDFALYDDNQVCIKGELKPKTDEFLGNTSIEYQGSCIAIWYVSKSNYDFDIFTSKIVHEMFHAFQNEQIELRYPNELKGLDYPANVENYNLKYNESKLIKNLLEDFKIEDLYKLYTIKKKRKAIIGEFFDYECKAEIFEGFANYVEIEALKMLDYDKYQIALKQMIDRINNIDNIFDIRKISYDLGALLLTIFDNNSIAYSKDLKTKSTIYDMISKNMREVEVQIENHPLIEIKTDEWVVNKQNLIYYVLNNATFICDIEYTLAGYDPYSARKFQNFIYHPYFMILQDKDGKNDVLYGTFVTRMKDNNLLVEKYFKL